MIELRPYQRDAVSFLFARDRGFVIAPAGSGKTVIAARAAALWMDAFGGKYGRVLWLANTQDQVSQAVKALEAEPALRCGFHVACVAAQPDPSTFALVIVDEAHHTPAATWDALVAAVRPNATLWGFSATPWHPTDEERNESVRRVFEVFYEVPREDVLASGHVLQGAVKMHDIDGLGEFDPEIERRSAVETARRLRRYRWADPQETARRVQWQFTVEAIEGNAKRNFAIAGIANAYARMGESVLILVRSIEHGKDLLALLGTDVEARLVYAARGKKARTRDIADFREGVYRIMLATSLADEGLDVPRASTIILAMGGRSPTKLIQRVGRVLRPFPGKTQGTIHDFLDKGSVYGYAQGRKRLSLYEEMGFETQLFGDWR